MILAILSAVGTLVPQNAELTDYIAKYGLQKYRILKGLGFTDIYHSWYFIGVFLWLTVSSIYCSTTRLKRTFDEQFNPKISYRRRFLENLPFFREIHLRESADPERIRDFLRAKGFVTRNEQEMTPDGPRHSIFAQRGMIRKWALVVLHFSIVFVFVGGALRSILGIDGSVAVRDGTKETLTVKMGGGYSGMFKYVLPDFALEQYVLDLKSFYIRYVKRETPPAFVSDQPPEVQELFRYELDDYVSDLTIINEGKTEKKLVRVNHPFIINGMVFYQNAFNMFVPVIFRAGDQEREVLVQNDRPFQITMEGVRFLDQEPPDPNVGFYFTLSQTVAGRLFNHDTKKEILVPPMSIFRVIDLNTGQPLFLRVISSENWIKLGEGSSRVSVRLGDKVENASIFSYKKDPGTPVIYFGFIFIILGAAITIYTNRNQIFISSEGRLLLYGTRIQGLFLAPEPLFDQFSGEFGIEDPEKEA